MILMLHEVSESLAWTPVIEMLEIKRQDKNVETKERR